MRFEFELSKKGFEKAVIKEIARQILTDENNESGISALSWDNPMREILIDKAHKLLKTEPEFEKKIMKDLKSELKNKRLITGIAKGIIKEKLEDYEQ